MLSSTPCSHRHTHWEYLLLLVCWADSHWHAWEKACQGLQNALQSLPLVCCCLAPAAPARWAAEPWWLSLALLPLQMQAVREHLAGGVLPQLGSPCLWKQCKDASATTGT